VAAAQCVGRKLELFIDVPGRAVTAGSEPVKLTPQNFTLLLWLARRRQAQEEPIHCSVYGSDLASAQNYLAVCREVLGEHSAETERMEAALKNGMDSLWFSPAKTRLNQSLVRALGENGAAAYLIRQVGVRKEARFELTLGAENIRIEECA